MLKFIFKNSLFYTFASQVPMFANLLLYPLISEHLSSFDYYIFGTAMGYLGMLMMLSDLGMTPLFQNAFFKKGTRYPTFWRHYLGFLFVYRFFFGLTAGCLVWFALYDQLSGERLWWVIALLVTPLVTFDLPRGIGMRLMQFKHRHHIVHRITLVAGAITVVTTFLTIYILRLGYLGFFISNFVSVLFQGIVFAWLIYAKEGLWPRIKLRRKRIASWLKISLPLVPHKFSDYLLSSSDRVVLDQSLGHANVSTSTVGMYNVAYSFAGYFSHFNNQVNTIVSPIYFSMFRDRSAEAPKLVRSFTLLWLALSFIAAALASLWSKEVFQFFFMNNQDGLANSYTYIIFLFMAFCYRPLYVASVDFIIFNERTTSLFKITTLAGILNVVLNIIFVPIYGVEAAVFSTYLCYMYMGISGHLFKDTRQYIPVSYRPLWIFAGITLAGFGLTYAVEWWWAWKVLISLILLGSLVLWYLWRGRGMIAQLTAYRLNA